MPHSIIFRSYGAYLIMLSPLGYKYFVPTGLSRFSQAILLSRTTATQLTEPLLTPRFPDAGTLLFVIQRSFVSLSAASNSVSSFLQKQNRTCCEPSAGSL